MTVITISRELGSEGDAIARKVAKTLRYRFVDKIFIGNVLSQYGLVEFEKEYDYLPTFWEKFNAQREDRRDTMVDMLNQVVRALAHLERVMILGRSGFAILGGFADVLNVRIQAPFALRVKRQMARKNITAYQAEDIVKQGDQVRAAFIKSFYGLQWETASAFDLVIDTGKIPLDLAVKWIVTLAEINYMKDSSDEPTVTTLKVDSVLNMAISNELEKLGAAS